MPEAVNPSGGTGPATPTPGAGVSTRQHATSVFTQMLNSERGSPSEAPGPETEEAAPKANRQTEAEPAEVEEPEAEDEAESTEDEAGEAEAEDGNAESDEDEGEEAEAEPDDEDVEIPKELSALAEGLGVDPAEFAEHVEIEITVDGQKRRITLAEAAKGYQREADYRQKTSEVAETRRQLDAERQRFNTEFQSRWESVGLLEQALGQKLQGRYSQEEMARLKREATETGDWTSYLERKDEFETDQRLFATIQQHRQQVAFQQEQERQKFRAQQQTLLKDLIPEFRDPDKRSGKQEDLAAYLQEQGFDAEQIERYFSGPFNAREVALVDKAMKYDRLQKTKPATLKKLKAKPKPVKPGKAKTTKELKVDRKASKDKELVTRLRKAHQAGKPRERTLAGAAVFRELLNRN